VWVVLSLSLFLLAGLAGLGEPFSSGAKTHSLRQAEQRPYSLLLHCDRDERDQDKRADLSSWLGQKASGRTVECRSSTFSAQSPGKMVFELIGFVTAAEGKEKELESLLKELTVGVETHEPDVERYIAYKVMGRRNNAGGARFVIIERFKDEATFQAHIKFDYFKEIGKRMEEQKLLAKPIEGIQVVMVGGFDSRESKVKL
jgi:quinol monooxygenase YgiN